MRFFLHIITRASVIRRLAFKTSATESSYLGNYKAVSQIAWIDLQYQTEINVHKNALALHLSLSSTSA